MDLEKVKGYLRIDVTHDDDLLSFLIDAAIEYLQNSGVPESESKRYELAIFMLVSHWYENREQNMVGTVSKEINFGLQTLILQLRVAD
ncbi:hypothetical protein BIV60_17150 [Bacillus sp. MUM 116]|nr:hypothetical protein BIV60_17150 [Bacillus sp. MUM 116]